MDYWNGTEPSRGKGLEDMEILMDSATVIERVSESKNVRFISGETYEVRTSDRLIMMSDVYEEKLFAISRDRKKSIRVDVDGFVNKKIPGIRFSRDNTKLKAVLVSPAKFVVLSTGGETGGNLFVGLDAGDGTLIKFYCPGDKHNIKMLRSNKIINVS